MVCHVWTFVFLGIGSIYENKLLTFLALLSLMLGLFFGKNALETLDLEEITRISEEDDEEPPLGIG